MRTAETTAGTTTTGPGRRGLAVFAAIFVVLTALFGGAQLLALVPIGTLERSITLEPAADRLAVRSGGGDLVLTPSADGKVHVRTVARYGLARPVLIQESTASGLLLDAQCDGWLGTNCQVDHTVEVPPSFAVIADGGCCDVTARGLTGPVTINRDSGDIALVDLSGPIDVRSSSGEITADRLTGGSVRAGTDSGDVQLDLLRPRSVRVDVSSGEVDLTVPDGGAYRVDVRTGSGEQQIDVPVDPAAASTISVSSDSGDVRLSPAR